MLKVKDVDYLDNYRLALVFSDGVKKEVDLEPYLKGVTVALSVEILK